MDRIEVDIGVGIQCGPWSCYDCFWREDDTPEEQRAIAFLFCWEMFAAKLR